MTRITEVHRIKAQPEVAWAVVADLDGSAELAGHVSRIDRIEGQGQGLIRHCVGVRGDRWSERCSQWEDGRLCRLVLEDGRHPLSLRTMEQSWEVQGEGEGVRLTVVLDYRPAYGPLGAVADRLFLRRRVEAMLTAWVHNVLARIREKAWSYTEDVSTILQSKGHDIVSVAPDVLVEEVAGLLAEKRIGVVLVKADDDRLAGLVSERDIVRGVASHGAGLLGMPVSHIMTERLVVCAPDSDLEYVLACMTDQRVRHLPVMDGDRLVGIVSIGDVVKQRMSSVERESEIMREHIAGREWRYHQTGPAVSDPGLLHGEVGQGSPR